MNDIKVTVNLAVFTVAVIIWIALGILKACPGYTLNPDLAFLFAALTGVVLTIVQGFEKGVTFSSTTETTTENKTTTTTGKSAAPLPEEIPAAPPPPEQ
jgi:uncharacterized membrane-anchored protein